jgi:hypothetical protein
MKLKPISEEWARTIGCITSAFTSLALIFGGGWTLYQYLDNRTFQLETARYESIKPIFEERLKLYVETTSAASTIATSKKEADVAKAKENFLRLYYGPLRLVEDFQIEKTSEEFLTCMQDNSKCTSPLTELSEKLTRACSGSLLSGGIPPSALVEIKVRAQQ